MNLKQLFALFVGLSAGFALLLLIAESVFSNQVPTGAWAVFAPVLALPFIIWVSVLND